MRKGEIKWFRGYKQVRIAGKVAENRVRVRFLEGTGKEYAIVRVENLMDFESEQANENRIRLFNEMCGDQAVLDKLKGC